MDEESFESAHNHDSETRGLGGAVSIDVVENARQYFEASEENPVNLEDVLLGMLDFSHELTVPSDDFDIKQFLEKFANEGSKSMMGKEAWAHVFFFTSTSCS